MIRFTEKISGKKLGLFLLPLMLSAVFQQIYEPVSAAVAGRYLNEEAVAVIGACSGWSGVVESLFVHMTTGDGGKNHAFFDLRKHASGSFH